MYLHKCVACVLAVKTINKSDCFSGLNNMRWGLLIYTIGKIC